MKTQREIKNQDEKNLRFNQWRRRDHTSPNLDPQACLSSQNTQESHKQGPPSPLHIFLQAIQHCFAELTLKSEPHLTASPHSSKCSIPLQQSPSSGCLLSTNLLTPESRDIVLGLKTREKQR